MISWEEFIAFKRAMAKSKGEEDTFNPMNYEDEYEDYREYAMGGNEDA